MAKITAEQLRLYAVSDNSWLKLGETLVQIAEQLLRHGVTCWQLRDKQATHEEIVFQTQQILPVCRAYGVPLIINDDVQAVLETDADGVHVGQSDMTVQKARAILGPEKIIGTSAHSAAEAIVAQQMGADYLGCGAVFGSATKKDGADYLGVGAVFHTSTKKDAHAVDFQTLKQICQSVSIPVVAIGGIDRHNILQLAQSGIDGVAVVSALFAAEDKPEAVKEMLRLANQIACK